MVDAIRPLAVRRSGILRLRAAARLLFLRGGGSSSGGSSSGVSAPNASSSVGSLPDSVASMLLAITIASPSRERSGDAIIAEV